MKEKKSSVSYKQILDETNQLIQISKLPEYEMMYANLPARRFTGHEDRPYIGQKCYKFMMGLEEQCPFCPMRQMNGREEYLTEIDNGQQVFTVKTKKIEWEGQDAFIEYATDITAIRHAQEVFKSQMELLLKSIPEAQGIFHLNLTKNTWISSNGVSQNVEELKDVPDVDMLIRQITAFIPNNTMKEEFLGNYMRESLINAYYKGKTEVVQELLSYYADNSIRWTRMTARLLMNPNTGDLECIVYGMDIQDEITYREKAAVTEREKEDILERAKRDMLTGVYGKKAFYKVAEEYLKENKNQAFALVFVDLDYFKQINDTLGHLMGDRVLVDTAKKLTRVFAGRDVVSRFGGDEFCILVKEVTEQELRQKLEILVREMRSVYRDGVDSAKVSVSVGAAFCTGKVEEVMTLIDLADKALYRAKEKGRDRYFMENYCE